MINLTGKKALVTGGARGIGAACARLLAQAGVDVGIAYRSRSEEAQALVSELELLGVQAFAFQGDLATAAANDAFVAKAVETFGHVDIFVGNAGVWPDQPVPVQSLDVAR